MIKGFHQIYGIDYEETFASTCKFGIVRLLLAWAAQLQLEIKQLDVKTAFLNPELKDQEIYMAQPEGFVIKGKENYSLRLKKTLYGLKQGPKLWY